MKTCNNCKICTDKNLAQIPYIEHEHRMYKAHQRELKLKGWLIATNISWFIGVIIWLWVG